MDRPQKMIFMDRRETMSFLAAEGRIVSMVEVAMIPFMVKTCQIQGLGMTGPIFGVEAEAIPFTLRTRKRVKPAMNLLTKRDLHTMITKRMV